MPLNADAELGRGRLDRFDDAIGSGRRGDEILAQLSNRLMVTAVDPARVRTGDGVAEDLVQFGAGDTVTSCAMAFFGSFSVWGSSVSTAVGMSWTSVPPVATFRTCEPRQIASNGTPESTARRARSISNSSRPGSASSVAG